MGKGSRRERQFHQLMSRAGWAAYRPATVQHGENDVWGLFDVLAIEPSVGLLCGVQVKSNVAKGLTAWSRHTWPWRRAGMATFYAVPYDNQGWRLIYVDDAGQWEDVVDERETDGKMGEGVVRWLNDA